MGWFAAGFLGLPLLQVSLSKLKSHRDILIAALGVQAWKLEKRYVSA